jgi:hypothetical protein
MQGAIDTGLIPVAGYVNADPPGIPQFALSGTAVPGQGTSIANAGSSAAIADDSNIVINALGDLTITSGPGTLLGNGTIAMQNDGQIEITSAAVIGDEIISIEAAGVLTLAGNSGVEITTNGAGEDVNILNAGRIDFDALGVGILTGVQSINGAVYPPSGSGATTSITQAGALVACLGSGGVTISSIGGGVTVNVQNAGTIAFDASGAGAITGLSTINGSSYPPPGVGSISSISGGGATVECDVASGGIELLTSNPFLTLDAGTVIATLSAGAANANIEVKTDNMVFNNPAATVSSIINMKDDGTIDLSGAAVNLINAGTIDFISSSGIITNLSTVNGAAFVNGSAPYVLPTNITVSTLTAASVSTTSLLVSSINGAAYPEPQYSLPADISVSTIAGVSTIEANPNVPFSFLHLGAFDFNISTLGNLTIDSALGMVLNGVSTIAGSDLLIESNNLKLVDAGGSGFNVLSAQPSVSGASGLVIEANLSVSTITDISTINGAVYPPVLDLPWTSTLGSGGFTSSINGADITTPGIQFTPISFPQVGNYTIYQKLSAVKTAGGAGQDIHMNVLYGDANIGVTDIYEGIGSVPYINEIGVSTLTTVVTNCFVSSINDTKSIYVFDQSANTYTADLVAANPVIQYNPAP